jgi:uncharacterized protein
VKFAGGSGVAGPSVWVVSDGRAGIERQALSLARALAAPPRAEALAHIRSRAHRAAPLRLKPFGWQLALPPNLWPFPMAALDDDERELVHAPWPDVWIGSGRRSIPYSRQIRRLSRGKTLVVQTQDPKVSLRNYDLIIPPLHDRLTGHNVFPILGPPTYYPEKDVAAAAQRFSDLAAERAPKLLVSIGGNSRTHQMGPDKVAGIEAAIRKAAADGWRLWITASRRTPEAVRIRLRALAAELSARFWENEDADGPNPYLAFLSLCDAALVTEDSANMLADPAWFGKPIHLLRLDGRSDRFDRMHQGFIDAGAARWFDGQIQRWTYQPIREAERAADEIARLLLERHPAPGLQKI